MRTRGFTVPEMLAVVAIIVIIISLLLPSLSKARDATKTVICLSNLHQLGLGWRAYANDNRGIIMGAHTDRDNYDWVDNDAAPALPTNELETNIRRGRMWAYVSELSMYKCPVDPRRDYLRSYSMNNFVGGGGWNVNARLRTSALPRPGQTMVMIEEPDPRGYNWGSWVIYPKGHPSASSWIDWAPAWHNDGCTLAFADGRAENWFWQDSRTRQIASFFEVHPGSPDLARLQEVFNPGD